MEMHDTRVACCLYKIRTWFSMANESAGTMYIEAFVASEMDVSSIEIAYFVRRKLCQSPLRCKPHSFVDVPLNCNSVLSSTHSMN